MSSIAITGIDGSGKSTVIKELHATLLAAAVEHKLFDKWDIVRNKFNECRFMNQVNLEEMKVCISEMPTISRWPFLFWTIAQSCSELSKLNPGIAIFDGHWMKHACAEMALGYPEDIIEAMIATLPKPDKTILLDIDPEFSLQRKRGALTPYECGLDPFLNESMFLSHQRIVRDRLLTRAVKEKWMVLDATLNRRDIHDVILTEVKKIAHFV